MLGEHWLIVVLLYSLTEHSCQYTERFLDVSPDLLREEWGKEEKLRAVLIMSVFITLWMEGKGKREKRRMKSSEEERKCIDLWF